jgi:hypothetical protein
LVKGMDASGGPVCPHEMYPTLRGGSVRRIFCQFRS